MQGRVFADRYRLSTKLGQGGMGSVWRAEHLTLRTQVAIKLIDPSIAESREALARFQREAQSAAELRSTHIVQIIDYGVDNGTPFIAMELLEGESLATRLSRVGRLSPQVTVGILSQVARALSRAHEKGVVHRDLKPDNIYIVREGEDEIVKVLDFGIAKKLDALSTSGGVQTSTGAMLGTPYYMSPEQALGQSGLDHRTDIWSLAVIAYECLTGARPFEKDTLGALLMAICHEALPAPSQLAVVPSGFDAWFALAAARDVSHRFQSATQAVAQLRAICDGSAPDTGATTPALIAMSPAVNAVPAVTALTETAVPASVTIGARSPNQKRSFLMLGAVAFVSIAAVGVYFAFRLSTPALKENLPVAASSPVPESAVQSTASAPSAVEPTMVSVTASPAPSTVGAVPLASPINSRSAALHARPATVKSARLAGQRPSPPTATPARADVPKPKLSPPKNNNEAGF